MLFLFLFLVFLFSAAALWFQGFWNCVITFINLMLSAMLATTFYEPVAGLLVKASGSIDHLADFLSLWLIFAVAFGLFRLASDLLCREKVVFPLIPEMAGRTVMSIWTAWVMVCFTAMSIHTAPLGEKPFGGFAEPRASSFLGLSPDRQWLAFMSSRSRGALSNGSNFDEKSTFVIRYHHKRMESNSE